MPRPAKPQQGLGAAIRTIRCERDLKQLDVAEEAGVTVTHLSRIENGRVNPTWSTIEDIARALGVSIVEIAQGASESP